MLDPADGQWKSPSAFDSFDIEFDMIMNDGWAWYARKGTAVYKLNNGTWSESDGGSAPASVPEGYSLADSVDAYLTVSVFICWKAGENLQRYSNSVWTIDSTESAVPEAAVSIIGSDTGIFAVCKNESDELYLMQLTNGQWTTEITARNTPASIPEGAKFIKEANYRTEWRAFMQDGSVMKYHAVEKEWAVPKESPAVPLDVYYVRTGAADDYSYIAKDGYMYMFNSYTAEYEKMHGYADFKGVPEYSMTYYGADAAFIAYSSNSSQTSGWSYWAVDSANALYEFRNDGVWYEVESPVYTGFGYVGSFPAEGKVTYLNSFSGVMYAVYNAAIMRSGSASDAYGWKTCTASGPNSVSFDGKLPDGAETASIDQWKNYLTLVPLN